MGVCGLSGCFLVSYLGVGCFSFFALWCDGFVGCRFLGGLADCLDWCFFVSVSLYFWVWGCGW